MEEAIDTYFEIFNAKLAYSNIMSIYILNKYTKESSEKRKKIKPRQLPQHHFSKTEGKRNPQDESREQLKFPHKNTRTIWPTRNWEKLGFKEEQHY